MNKVIKTKSAKQIVDEIFEQQEARMGAMAMIPHEQNCPKVGCSGCFKWEPDKIVATYYLDVEDNHLPKCPCPDCM